MVPHVEAGNEEINYSEARNRLSNVDRLKYCFFQLIPRPLGAFKDYFSDRRKFNPTLALILAVVDF